MNVTINEGSGADLKELIDLQKQMLECLLSQQRLLAGIGAVLAKVVGDAEETNIPSPVRPPSPTVGQVVPMRPPVPPPTFVDEPGVSGEVYPTYESHPPPAEKIVYSEDFATAEESGLISHTEEQREQIDMEASLRELGIEIDDASIPFPGPEHSIGEV